MSVRKFLALAPMAAAAVLTLAAPMSANALSVVYDNLTATGTYSLNGGAAVNVLPWLDTATAKDVLEFGGDGTNYYGMHNYGDTNGYFGSRSSGQGYYDVTGSFSISLTLTNDKATAQAVGFDFFITPGTINLLPFLYGTGQFAQSSVSFDISVGGSSLWNSTALLRADDSNQAGSWSQTGANLYSGSGLSYMVNGGSQHLDLGVLDAGQSLSLTYTLKSAAKGNAINGTTTTIPAYDEVVPGHWVEYWDCGSYGEPTAAGGDGVLMEMAAAAVIEGPGSCDLKRVYVDEYINHHGEQVLTEGTTGGSESRTGDPFSFGTDPVFGNVSAPPGQDPQLSFTSVDLTTNVPEPGALSLVALALAGAGVARRRRG